MVADLRKMQENQGVSENRIDKSRFVCFILLAFKLAGGEQRFMLFANGKSTRDRHASIARECSSFGGTR